uniref:Minor histocompatibility antigen H13 n=1 Tax=Glossina brevipalpis TaxID=37001 RepID=A0A1A9WKV6_9MUSC
MRILETLFEIIKEILRAFENASSCEIIRNEKKDYNSVGAAVACGCLVIMAMLSIFFGSKQAVNGEKHDAMSKKDAVYFPIISSFALFGLYLSFKIFSKFHINLLLTGYSCLLGVTALTHSSRPLVNFLMSSMVSKIPFHILCTKGKGRSKENLINLKFSAYDIICLIISITIGIWYLARKHWIAKNIFGLAFAVNALEMLHLSNIVTGFILLIGLFFYDIFWSLGANVIVSIAKSFEAPIMLVFPQDWISNGINGSNFIMLSLGDIIIPGIFIALLLRFDNSIEGRSSIYFYSALVAYFIGLMATIVHRIVFKQIQPARLFLVPTCLTTPLLVALLRGEIETLFAYDDHSENKAKKSQSKGLVKPNGKSIKTILWPSNN